MKIALIGRSQLLYETALELHKCGHEIDCFVIAKATPECTRNENDFQQLARQYQSQIFLTNSLERPEIEGLLRGLDIGISVNWISMIKKRHIDLFRLGILNSHHGELPKYRGNAPSNWAIINNEDRITNTIHFMEADNLDCGRIICEEHFGLQQNTTITDFCKWVEKSTPRLFAKALRILGDDSEFVLRFAEAGAVESFRCYPRLPEDGFIRWELPVLKIHNLVRAVCSPYPGAYTYHSHKGRIRKLIVLKSRIVQTETKDIAIPGHVLENNRETGESYIRCGAGVIALINCRYEDEEDEFSPGKRWKSIRMRVGVRAEDWLWEISKKIENEQGA